MALKELNLGKHYYLITEFNDTIRVDIYRNYQGIGLNIDIDLPKSHYMFEDFNYYRFYVGKIRYDIHKEDKLIEFTGFKDFIKFWNKTKRNYIIQSIIE